MVRRIAYAAVNHACVLLADNIERGDNSIDRADSGGLLPRITPELLAGVLAVRRAIGSLPALAKAYHDEMVRWPLRSLLPQR